MKLIILAIVAFVQNMAFTWSSRSRNSGHPWYHFRVAILSNGIWFGCNFFLVLPQMLDVLKTGNHFQMGLVMVVYVVSTSLGSMVMMKWLLKKEKGKNQVGAR